MKRKYLECGLVALALATACVATTQADVMLEWIDNLGGGGNLEFNSKRNDPLIVTMTLDSVASQDDTFDRPDYGAQNNSARMLLLAVDVFEEGMRGGALALEGPSMAPYAHGSLPEPAAWAMLLVGGASGLLCAWKFWPLIG